MKDRIYVCHTFYHAYVAILKELEIRKTRKDTGAALVLSTMSNDFGNLKERVVRSGLFEDVFTFEEKDYTYFPELVELKKDRGNIVFNSLQRIKFCKKLGKLQEKYIPVDFRSYKDIYVFCDSDPIGYYLFYKKIKYHAVEDGLNCIRYRDTAREDNAGHFGFKSFLAQIGILFIQNGYSKYCIDMEVNDISVLDNPIDKMVEKSREELVSAIDDEGKKLLCDIFIENRRQLSSVLDKASESGLNTVLVLSEPLCKDLTVRKKLFSDLIDKYGVIDGKKAKVFIKPHPRDALDYKKEFKDEIVMDSHFPMEILNFLGATFDRVVTVYTVPSSIHCAKEKIYLGNEWMDHYEDPKLHAHVKNSKSFVTKEGK